MEYYKGLHINGKMIMQHFSVKQLRIDKTIGILQSCVKQCKIHEHGGFLQRQSRNTS